MSSDVHHAVTHVLHHMCVFNQDPEGVNKNIFNILKEAFRVTPRFSFNRDSCDKSAVITPQLYSNFQQLLTFATPNAVFTV